MKKSEREELKRLAEAATPGPWRTATWTTGIRGTEVMDKHHVRISRDMLEHNAGFVAYANPAAIQSLLAYVDRLEAQRDRLLIALSALHDTACKCDGWESFPSTALDAASAAITEAESQT